MRRNDENVLVHSGGVTPHDEHACQKHENVETEFLDSVQIRHWQLPELLRNMRGLPFQNAPIFSHVDLPVL